MTWVLAWWVKCCLEERKEKHAYSAFSFFEEASGMSFYSGNRGPCHSSSVPWAACYRLCFISVSLSPFSVLVCLFVGGTQRELLPLASRTCRNQPPVTDDLIRKSLLKVVAESQYMLPITKCIYHSSVYAVNKGTKLERSESWLWVHSTQFSWQTR